MLLGKLKESGEGGVRGSLSKIWKLRQIVEVLGVGIERSLLNKLFFLGHGLSYDRDEALLILFVGFEVVVYVGLSLGFKTRAHSFQFMIDHPMRSTLIHSTSLHATNVMR
ncbi:hypothetical protein V6N12_003245 [Hibiscus sabdariffa]|uniref:Uncharacterized protein n=1 Tax=Hibiscus sabdariffa TaxID=183260 RepID=A0ABR2EDG5_9ROSI